MPRLSSPENSSNIIRIEPNPLKRSSVKVKMFVNNVAGGQPVYSKTEDDKRKYQYKMKEPKNLSRLPNTKVVYTAALSKNGLRTGLEESIKNPYSEEDYYTSPEWEKILKGKDKIRIQEMLEYKHNKPRGYYTNQISSVRASDDMEEAPFYQRPESRVSLNDGITFLDLSNPIQEVQYYMLRVHPNIALSYEDCQFNPNATHYIVNPQDKTRNEAEGVRRKNKIASRLEEIMELGDNTIFDFCKALYMNKVHSDRNEAYIALENHVGASNETHEDFMTMYDLWKSAATRDRFMGYVELYDYTTIPDLVRIRGNKLYWNQPVGGGNKHESWEWKSKDHFVNAFLLAPEYQEEVEILRQQYKAKTRFKIY